MQNHDLSFLSERISQPANETAFFLVDTDPVFVRTPEGDDLKRDQLLLKFTQRIWELPEAHQHEVLSVYHSLFYDEKTDYTKLYVHDIIYQDFLQHKLELTTSISCTPTLSFRTLVCDDYHHIKFGLPIFYGSVVRRNTKKEVLTSLYLADYIRGIPKIDKLDFFLEYKGYSLLSLEDYSVSYRKKECPENTIPISCYFNKLLNHSEGTPKERLGKTLDFLSTFFQDFDPIYADLKLSGLGLEIHGQNLLVKLDSEGSFSGEYLYRDLGTCTIDPKIQKRQTDLNQYYKANYDFDFPEGQLIDAGYYAWMNYRNFFLSFLLYNLNKFVENEKINVNVYDWFGETTKDLLEINSIY